MHMSVKNASEYDGRFPLFRQPFELGHFSLDSERVFKLDNSQMKYLAAPSSTSELNMCLSEGYSQAIKKIYSKKEKIDTILRWILLNREKISKSFRVDDRGNPVIDFISFRGLITMLCATIYENKQDWLVCATKYKSAIYLCAFDTEDDVKRRENMSDREQLMCSWGYKFEQYMTAETPDSDPVINVPVNEREEYCIMLKGGLNNHVLLFSAEIDAVDADYLKDSANDPKSPKRYIELKTSRIITTEKQNQNFCRFKLIKWWIQSFLVGIPKIISGFRDDDGYVRVIRTFDVKDIPKLSQEFWSPSACLNFCSNFFDFVKSCVIKDNPRVVYKFYWKPGRDITCEEVPYPSEFQILPDWYISQMENI